MNKTRRLWLQAALALGALAASLGMPRALLAAWPKAPFTARDADAALRDLFGISETALIPSDKILLDVPDVAENGTIVPVMVTSELEGVESITLLANKNPHPMTSSYLIPKGTLAYVATRIKMQETADVVAVVKANGKFYSVAKRVQVAIGGCS